MNLQAFLKEVGKEGCDAEIVRYAKESEALEAVKQDGDALQYVDVSIFFNQTTQELRSAPSE
jgi:hypothetical protein